MFHILSNLPRRHTLAAVFIPCRRYRPSFPHPRARLPARQDPLLPSKSDATASNARTAMIASNPDGVVQNAST